MDHGQATLLCGIYHYHLKKWAKRHGKDLNMTESLWKVPATTLSEQLEKWEMRSTEDNVQGKLSEVPTVTVKKIHKALEAGLTPVLFIEDLDKYKMACEYQNSMFSDVINCVCCNGGVIIATSGVHVKTLESRMGKPGRYILRRIVVLPKGVLVDFTSGKVVDSQHERTLSEIPVGDIISDRFSLKSMETEATAPDHAAPSTKNATTRAVAPVRAA